MASVSALEPMSPVYTAPLFAPLHDELITLLDRLTPDDWMRPTIAGAWLVRDVVAHLVEIDLRRLSVGRDRHWIEPSRPIEGYAGLVAFLNGLNADWVAAARRFSPRVLVDLLRQSGPAVADLFAGLPPHAPATFGVAWAGEPQSDNWFDIGRDYTERWHHQMQIRDATGVPGLLQARWLLPLLDLSVRCLPRAYAGVAATGDAAGNTAGNTAENKAENKAVVLRVASHGAVAADADIDVAWTLLPRAAPDPASGLPLTSDPAWTLWRGVSPAPTTTVHLDPDTAWRLFYNALSADAVRQQSRVEGDAAMAAPLFRARAVMV